MMPKVDGFELIEYLKHRHNERPAIIVISAGEPGSLRHLDGSMVHSIVRKPFDIDVLGDLINAAAQSMTSSKESKNAGVLQFPKNNVC